MKLSTVSELLSSTPSIDEIEIKGWVRTFRANRFIALNDGSTINNIQCVVDFEKMDESILKRITTGSAIHIKGELVESLGSGQNVEITVKSLDILGDSDPEAYPIQPKKHSFEFLRSMILWHAGGAPTRASHRSLPTSTRLSVSEIN